MQQRPYPISIAELDEWRKTHETSLDEAKKRFAQFVALQSIASLFDLRESLVFKGGNALRFVYMNKRSTLDLDFTATALLPDDAEQIVVFLDRAFLIGAGRYSVKLKCQHRERNPPGRDKTIPTYLIKAGYQFPGDNHYMDFDQWQRPFSSVIELEISLNDVVCETRDVLLSPQQHTEIRVCVLEDILAEKLRALLQQRLRNRYRWQDVYDIARMARLHSAELDFAKISKYFLEKSSARSVVARKSCFDNEIKTRASFEYGTLFDLKDPEFIPFDEAWQDVMCLVASLDIPS